MRKGNINRGYVKTTVNQKKKHYTQMSKEELTFLKSQIQNIKDIKPSWHLENKASIEYKMEDVFKVVTDSDLENRIIEFNVTPSRGALDKRVLLRSKEVYLVDIDGKEVDCNLCFVISLKSHQLITVYYNEYNDSHDTIDWKRYDENLKII